MTDGTVRTRLRAGDRWLEFQEYFVRERHCIPVTEIQYAGIDSAPPTQDVITALRAAEMIILVNSNPTLSILPILTLPGMWNLVAKLGAPRIAVSPIVGSDAVTGPAGDLMRLLGRQPTAQGIAETYHGIIDGIVIDRQDEAQAASIERLGIRALCTDIVMRSQEDRERLAEETLRFGRRLR
jgi:LPPG:FO 2-phospho-L-lactate transferase